MQTVVILAAFLLVAGVSAEQPQEVSNVQPVPAQANSQPSHVAGHTSAVESMGPQAGPGGNQQHFAGGPMVSFEQPMPPAAPQYYSPAGMVQVVGQQSASGEQQQQQSGAKPGAGQMTVRHYAAAGAPEQYGQPESASIPPNYKPFGSWGLYIGGNPADGYYTNYYKALSNNVADKQQAGGESPAKPQAFVGQASGFGAGAAPTMKQGPAYPQAAFQEQGSFYPYGEYYTPADLNSGSRVTVQNQMVPSAYSSGFATEYQQPPQPAAMYYGAETYAATKKGAPAPPAAFAQKETQAPLSPAKGYQQRMSYAYSAQAAYPQAPTAVVQASYQPQPQPQPQATVVAYPVPVGSQMVGSQPGTDGAYQPYGVHAFTRYAVKPTVVTTEQAYYPAGVHSAPAGQFPYYKQQQQQFVTYTQPMSFYGYPLNQLHYSTGAFGSQAAPASGGPAPAGSPGSQAYSAGVQQFPQGATVVEHSGPVAHGPAMPVEAASSEKSETTSEVADKTNHAGTKHQQQQQQQQQKRA